MTQKPNRRDFGKAGVGAAASISLTASGSLANEKVIGANERVRVALVGVGNRGSQLINAFSQHADCQIAAVADVFEPYLRRATQKISELFRDKIDVYEDYRKILDRTDVDAIVVATPDHWHALQTIHAIAAGKDVYVEKPLSTTIVEGRKMVEAAVKHNRIVQVGLQRRSMKIYQQLAEYLRSGELGQITVSRAYRLNNMFPDGIGKSPTSSPPAGLNWDMWLGPRPYQDYQDNIAPYKFRWWLGYSSQMGNWGVHYFDLIRWMLGEEGPKSVVCVGGNYAVADDRTIPDTAEAIFEMPQGSLLVFGQYEASSNPALAWGEVEFRGTEGTVYAASSGYQVVTERPGQFQAKKPRAKSGEFQVDEPRIDATAAHARDFLDSVKNRKSPRCPVEDGHRSTIFAHLANISLATHSRLEWDAAAERCVGNERANELLHYEYRDGYQLPDV